jgi:hypothetical protein
VGAARWCGFSPGLGAVLVERSLDLGVAVPKGRCGCRLEVSAAGLQLGSAEQA